MELRPYKKADLTLLNSWLDNMELVTLWTGRKVDIPLTDEQMHEFHHSSESVNAFVIVLNDKPVGYLETHLKPERNIHLARLLVGDKSLRGKGVMQKVLEGLIEQIFKFTPAKRITLNVFADNKGAYHCYLKSGFTEYSRSNNYLNTGKDMIAMQLYRPIPGLND